jgi:hypothetical protein
MIFDRLSRHLGFSNLARLFSRVSNLGLLYLCSPLPTYENSSKRRLEQLLKKLERNGQYKQYNDIIQQQLNQGVIELAPTTKTAK